MFDERSFEIAGNNSTSSLHPPSKIFLLFPLTKWGNFALVLIVLLSAAHFHFMPTTNDPNQDAEGDEVVNAKPLKRFFVEFLVRDIELQDAVGDLVDNAVDAAKGKRQLMGASEILINFSSDSFKISDNCGGMSIETARDYAFRFGRPQRRTSIADESGRYGIGMKRALFKLGDMITVQSSTDGSHFKVNIDVKQWIADDGEEAQKPWTFPFAEAVHETRTDVGTIIEVTDIHDEMSEELNDPKFESLLIDALRQKHSSNLADGLTIRVNGYPVTSQPLNLKYSELVRPSYFAGTINGTGKPVHWRVIAGLDEKPDAAKAGWYVACNGRFILEADKSKKTGWGDAFKDLSIPKMHYQFAQFRGYAFFDCEDSSRLPQNTTKTGVDAESPIYKQVKTRMIEATRPVINCMNNIHREEDADEKPYSNSVKVAEMQSIFSLMDGSTLETGSFDAKKSKVEARGEDLLRISYQASLEKVRRAREKSGKEKNKELGLYTFDYYYARECR